MKASEHCPICSSFTFHCNHILPPSGWERTIHMLHCTLRVCFYDISDNCSSKRWRRRLHRVDSVCVCVCVSVCVCVCVCVVADRGYIEMYSMRKIMCFWDTEACRSILVDPKNKIMNIENVHNRSTLMRNTVASISLSRSRAPHTHTYTHTHTYPNSSITTETATGPSPLFTQRQF